MLKRLLSFIRPPHLDGAQGAGEQRSKPYMKYGERVAETATPRSAKSTSGAAGSASRQAGAVRGSEGITSIVVVFVLVTLLTLIGIGFTKIMNRSLQSSAASQQATAANYAAQSGVNDVLSYLKTQPDTSATKCDDLIKTGAPLSSAAKISGDGSTAYTCVLVDPNPTSLFYQSLNPYKSQIVKITTSAPLASLLFSWQSPNRQHNQLVPAGPGQTLYDEKTWSDKNYAPLLRVTLYPIPAGGDLSGVQAASKTFFLYPQAGGSNTLSYATAGDTSAVNCSSKNIGGFAGSADYDCNLVINNLPGAAYFYARFAPYYDQAAVKIKGNDGSGQAVKFKNVQSVVDVTAKSGGATKRLQARVDTSAASGIDFNLSAGSDNAPEFALGSAGTICKRLLVPPSPASPVSVDPGSAANCNLSLASAKPTVSLSASPLNVSPGGSSTLTWTSTNADSCTASGGWSGAKDTNSSASTGALAATTTFTLTCHNAAGDSLPSSATVTVTALPPPPPPPPPPGGGGDKCPAGQIGAPPNCKNPPAGHPKPTASIIFSNWNPPDNGANGQHYTATFNITSTNAISCRVTLSYYDASSGGTVDVTTNGSSPIGDFYYGEHRSGLARLTCSGPGGTSDPYDAYTPWLSEPIIIPPAYTVSITRWLVQQVPPGSGHTTPQGCADQLHSWTVCAFWATSHSNNVPYVVCSLFWKTEWRYSGDASGGYSYGFPTHQIESNAGIKCSGAGLAYAVEGYCKSPGGC